MTTESRADGLREAVRLSRRAAAAAAHGDPAEVDRCLDEREARLERALPVIAASRADPDRARRCLDIMLRCDRLTERWLLRALEHLAGEAARLAASRRARAGYLYASGHGRARADLVDETR